MKNEKGPPFTSKSSLLPIRTGTVLSAPLQHTRQLCVHILFVRLYRHLTVFSSAALLPKLPASCMYPDIASRIHPKMLSDDLQRQN